ncbi:hypothetical protein CkP1_0141 [Citrobacter phage CkP1]|nr:hypothetical protein CkP1_0141 [Citrobacter phage CkP1]
MFYETRQDIVSSERAPVLSQKVVNQLISGGVPRELLTKMTPYIDSMTSKYEIHRDQFKRIKCGHVKVSSQKNLKELLNFLRKECYSIEYTGNYAFYYDDISINNQDYEVSTIESSRFTNSSHFAFNLECKLTHLSKKFRFSILISRDETRNNFDRKYNIKDVGYTGDRESKILNIAKFISSYDNKDYADTMDISGFVEICRREVQGAYNAI